MIPTRSEGHPHGRFLYRRYRRNPCSPPCDSQLSPRTKQLFFWLTVYGFTTLQDISQSVYAFGQAARSCIVKPNLGTISELALADLTFQQPIDTNRETATMLARVRLRPLISSAFVGSLRYCIKEAHTSRPTRRRYPRRSGMATTSSRDSFSPLDEQKSLSEKKDGYCKTHEN